MWPQIVVCNRCRLYLFCLLLVGKSLHFGLEILPVMSPATRDGHRKEQCHNGDTDDYDDHDSHCAILSKTVLSQLGP